MKLWMKLSFIALACTLTAFSVCLYVFTAWQSEQLITAAEGQARSSLKLFCANLESIDRQAAGNTDAKLTNRSITQYYFATYAHLLGGGSYFSLACQGEYLYNTCPFDVLDLLAVPSDCEEAWNTFDMDGYRVVVGRPINVLNQEYTVYLCADVSSAYAQVRLITRMSAFMLALSAAFVMALAIPLVRRALRPIQALARTADSISGGEYHLRAKVETGDEIAALATSFNHMADAIETRIEAITEESERRKLLLGALAHELKTPMTAIIGFADSLLRVPLTEEQKQNCAEQIHSAGLRTERMSQKLMLLLSLSENEALERQLFEIEPFAQELLKQYATRIRVTRASEHMYGDRDLLLSLAQNLINNALNAADTAEITLADGFIQVSDKGRGIAPEHLSRLTEPFYRVDKARSRKHGGAGLGLSLCKAICISHGGTLTIESKIGVGTTATARFEAEAKSHE